MVIAISEIEDDRIAVKSPYDQGYIAAAKSAGGRWDAGFGGWVFAAAKRDDVERLLTTYFGWSAAPCVLVEAAAIGDHEAERGAVHIAGVEIATASGRRSGVSLARGVTYLGGGRVESGENGDGWQTVITAGARFRVALPSDVVEKGLSGWSFQIVNADPRKRLETERASLRARIAEIDRLLDEDSDTDSGDSTVGEWKWYRVVGAGVGGAVHRTPAGAWASFQRTARISGYKWQQMDVAAAEHSARLVRATTRAAAEAADISHSCGSFRRGSWEQCGPAG